MSLDMDIRVFADAKQIAREAEGQVIGTVRAAIGQHGICRIALAGGSTPRALYSRLAKAPGIDWSLVDVCFGDERLVPPDHAESNYRMAREALLAHVPVPDERVHRVRTELGDAEGVAADYEQTLHDLFGIAPDAWPRFDLVLLGMGADGHTASLFPHTAVLDERSHAVAAVHVDKLRAWRITLTLPVLMRARHTLVLVSGRDKAAALHAVLEGPRDPHGLPIQFLVPDRSVSGTSGHSRAELEPRDLTWLIDADAASSLHLSPTE